MGKELARNDNQLFEAHHEGFKVGSPPLRQTITNLPLVVDTMRRIELFRLVWRSQTFVHPSFETIDVVFSWLQVVSRSAGPLARGIG